MAYSAPPRWAAGDRPTAALMNVYSDDLNAIHDISGDALINIALPTNTGDIIWTMFHRYRWLAYNDNGSIRDPTGANEDIELSDPGSGVFFYDLSTVPWLAPGLMYMLVNFDQAWEVDGL